MTLLVPAVVFPCKAEVVNIFQVLIISACVMRVGTLVIILRNINDLANGVRAQGGSILQQVGQYRAGGIGCTRAIGLKDTTQPSCQWRLMEGIILLLKSTFTLDYETSKSKCYLFIVISLFIIIFPFLLSLVLFFILRSVQSLICNFWLKTWAICFALYLHKLFLVCANRINITWT